MSTWAVCQLIGWIGNILSLCGSFCVARGNRWGYCIFLFAESLLLVPIVYGHVWNQIFLFFAFAVMNIYGFIHWGRKNKIPPLQRSSLFSFYQHVQIFASVFKSKKDFGLRLALTVEELGELTEAIQKDWPIQEQEDEWADLLYVVLGWGYVFEYDIYGAMQRVMAKNQKKIENAAGMRISKHGKILSQ